MTKPEHRRTANGCMAAIVIAVVLLVLVTAAATSGLVAAAHFHGSWQATPTHVRRMASALASPHRRLRGQSTDEARDASQSSSSEPSERPRNDSAAAVQDNRSAATLQQPHVQEPTRNASAVTPQELPQNDTAATPQEPPRNLSATILQELSPLQLPKLREEAQFLGLTAAGGRQELVVRIQRHVLSHFMGASNVSDELEADGNVFVHGEPDVGEGSTVGEADISVLGQPDWDDYKNWTDPNPDIPDWHRWMPHHHRSSEAVQCTCQERTSSRHVCSPSGFHNLHLCYMGCSAHCRKKGMRYHSCNNEHMVLWLGRLGYRHREC